MTSADHVKNILSEHETVRKIVGSVGGYFNDLDAFFRLQTERFDLTQTSLGTLAEKKQQLQATIDELWTNLGKHFQYEEEHLTQALGDTLSRALKLEHDEIGAEIEKVKGLLAGASFQGLSQAEILSAKTTLQNAIGRLSGMIEEHARDEEVLVKMIKKAMKPK